MIGVPGFRPILLTSALAVVAAAALATWQYEHRPTTTQQAVAATPQRAEPRALSPEEETYAAALWEIQRQVTVSAVAMSYAGISYEIDNHDVQVLEQKIEPVAKFFVEAEPQVRGVRRFRRRCRRFTTNTSKRWFSIAKPATKCSRSPRTVSGSILSTPKAWASRRRKTSCAPARCFGRGSTSHTDR